jgi:hypothetical protein
MIVAAERSSGTHVVDRWLGARRHVSDETEQTLPPHAIGGHSHVLGVPSMHWDNCNGCVGGGSAPRADTHPTHPWDILSHRGTCCPRGLVRLCCEQAKKHDTAMDEPGWQEIGPGRIDGDAAHGCESANLRRRPAVADRPPTLVPRGWSPSEHGPILRWTTHRRLCLWARNESKPCAVPTRRQQLAAQP